MGLGLHCCSSLSRSLIPDVDECFFIRIDDFSDLVFEPANAVCVRARACVQRCRCDDDVLSDKLFRDDFVENLNPRAFRRGPLLSSDFPVSF